MEWLQIVALTLTMADGAYTCHAINNKLGMEGNKFMPSTCKGIILQKAAMAAPMFVIKSGKWRNTFIGINMVGGGIGLSVSVYNLNK